ncbi:hypothetical protein ACJX0J_014749 [Zea mays]
MKSAFAVMHRQNVFFYVDMFTFAIWRWSFFLFQWHTSLFFLHKLGSQGQTHVLFSLKKLFQSDILCEVIVIKYNYFVYRFFSFEIQAQRVESKPLYQSIALHQAI